MKETIKTIMVVVLTVVTIYGGLWSWSYITNLRQVVGQLDKATNELVKQNRTLTQSVNGQCVEILTGSGYKITPPPPPPQ